MKKRVLVVSENHMLNSGFGTYAKEILNRLHATGKYELAEFASYGSYESINKTKWLYYANTPADHNSEEFRVYNSNPLNHFGFWRFDRVCLDFKPDIVMTYRDPWMDLYIDKSSLRKYFAWIHMPTVDSAPQKEEWIDAFNRCDAILGYSEFGVDTIRKQSCKANVLGCASPAANYEIYKPIDKKTVRESLGLPKDAFVVGTVMRNQKRKLFAELLKTYKIYLENLPISDRKNNILYLHTSYPEKNGWNIPELIQEIELMDHVYGTYLCKECSHSFTDKFLSAISFCPKCNGASVLPNVAFGVTQEQLALTYNAMDLYIQYANCEGFGMPLVEAAACGTKIAATNYSAMSDIIRNVDGLPIDFVLSRELETNAERALPLSESLLNILNTSYKGLKNDKEYFDRTKADRIAKCKTRYSYDNSAEQWMSFIDNHEPKDLQSKWDIKIPIAEPAKFNECPPNLNNEQFIHWLYSNVLHNADRYFSYEGAEYLQQLNYGVKIDYGLLENVDRKTLYNEFIQIAIMQKETEKARMTPPDKLMYQDYIIEAHRRKVNE